MKAHRQIATDTSRDKNMRVVDRTLSTMKTVHLEDLAAVSQAAMGTKLLEHYSNLDRNVKAQFTTWG